MPFKLSEISGLADGISSGLQSTVDTGAGTSLHDGLPGQLLTSGLDGSATPLVSAALLLAAGGIFAVRNRLASVTSLSGALPV
ncbi:hypothetical protein [Blastococcus sp. CT_GayMR16]|uniref:hypothetical protein n=1 Tax=Blastococcus sp. CT_GayMR16 TaxID=2559607 RepID=UPI0010745398|nr:hypothetical protein [Blastococcus sp. CT_GayMR16]TFV90602.1 hypothetical protein E4P38_04095 [Blastococcus sp. CT_GayMR16]